MNFEGYILCRLVVSRCQRIVANGLNAGINPDKKKNDMCLVYSQEPCSVAGVYTQNKVKGAPVIVTRENLKKSHGIAHAILANSKNANTCNFDGIEIAEKACRLAADQLGIKPEEVILGSTGVIGQRLSIQPFEDYMKPLAEGMTADGNDRAAYAIMTTDTVMKQVAVEFKIGDALCRMGGMAKGSGMIHPNMATTLNFLTSDVAITPELSRRL